MKIDVNRKFETDEEYVDFLMSFINGDYGKIYNIEKILDKEYKLYLEDGFYIIGHHLVYLTSYRHGAQLALYYEHGEYKNGNMIAVFHRKAPQIMIKQIFEALNKLYQSRLINTVSNARGFLEKTIQSLNGYDFINKIHRDTFVLRKNDENYIFYRKTSYINNKLNYQFTIHHDNQELVRFET